jgi:hypothetical protein
VLEGRSDVPSRCGERLSVRNVAEACRRFVSGVEKVPAGFNGVWVAEHK